MAGRLGRGGKPAWRHSLQKAMPHLVLVSGPTKMLGRRLARTIGIAWQLASSLFVNYRDDTFGGGGDVNVCVKRGFLRCPDSTSNS